jgi:hypothetical protein
MENREARLKKTRIDRGGLLVVRGGRMGWREKEVEEKGNKE